MTGTTHQIIALVGAFWLLTLYPLHLGPLLGFLSVVVIMVGALTPDLDQPTANLWRRLLGGRAFGNIFQRFSGGHRHLTHSLLGIILIAAALRWGINTFISPTFHSQFIVLWVAYLVGYISHPLADTITDHGVPWFWPLNINLKFPPGPEELRVTTGSFVEMFIVRGALIVIALLLFSTHGATLIRFFAP